MLTKYALVAIIVLCITVLGFTLVSAQLTMRAEY